MYAPIWQLAFISGYGPRVAEPALSLIAGHAYSAPYEDVRLKGSLAGPPRELDIA